MIVRLVPLEGPVRSYDIELLKNGTTVVRGDDGFICRGEWSKEGEDVLEITVDDVDLRAPGAPQRPDYLAFPLYDDARNKR